MELKPRKALAEAAIELLLIVPYGIETIRFTSLIIWVVAFNCTLWN